MYTALKYGYLFPNSLERFGKRHHFALLAFLGLANVMALRIIMSLAVVAMVDPNDQSTEHSSLIGKECPFNNTILPFPTVCFQSLIIVTQASLLNLP